MQYLLLFASLLVFGSSYHEMWIFFIVSIFTILIYMHRYKEINGKYYALYFYLLCMSIGFICNLLSGSGIINKENDANLMIVVVIGILICSERINMHILKNKKEEMRKQV